MIQKSQLGLPFAHVLVGCHDRLSDGHECGGAIGLEALVGMALPRLPNMVRDRATP